MANQLGEVEPYKGPKTPEGRVSANLFLGDIGAWCQVLNQRQPYTEERA